MYVKNVKIFVRLKKKMHKFNDDTERTTRHKGKADCKHTMSEMRSENDGCPQGLLWRPEAGDYGHKEMYEVQI